MLWLYITAPVVGILLLSIIVICCCLRAKNKRSYAPRSELPRGTVLLFQFARGPRAPSISPFPLKLETYLRATKMPYKNDLSSTMSEKGKTPWMQLNGENIADSQFCIEHLKKLTEVDMDVQLSSAQRATAHALRVMIDEHLYWGLVMERWIYSPMSHRKEMFYFLPSWVRPLFFFLVGRKLRNQVNAQGTGRHTQVEVMTLVRRDLETLSNTLGNNQYLMGERISEVDCSAFGMLANLAWNNHGLPMSAIMQEFPNLEQYCFRIKAELWPDWEECVTQPKWRSDVTPQIRQ